MLPFAFRLLSTLEKVWLETQLSKADYMWGGDGASHCSGFLQGMDIADQKLL